MTEYFLQVDLIVHKDDHKDFEAKVQTFMDKGGFGQIDLLFKKELVFALRTRAAIAYGGYNHYQSYVPPDDVREGPAPRRFRRDDRLSGRSASLVKQSTPAEDLQDHFRYVNVWRIDDLKELDLARLMTLCSDDQPYRKINELVVREVQNFVLRVPWLTSLPELAASKRMNVVRVTRQLTTRELGTYLFSLGALLPTFDSLGFRTLGYFQNVTGPLNTVTEFWETEGEGLETILRLSPAELSQLATKGGRGLDEVVKAHQNQPETYVYELLESYLTLDSFNLGNVNRSRSRQRRSDAAQAAE
jgi:hypothetical protein